MPSICPFQPRGCPTGRRHFSMPPHILECKLMPEWPVSVFFFSSNFYLRLVEVLYLSAPASPLPPPCLPCNDCNVSPIQPNVALTWLLCRRDRKLKTASINAWIYFESNQCRVRARESTDPLDHFIAVCYIVTSSCTKHKGIEL